MLLQFKNAATCIKILLFVVMATLYSFAQQQEDVVYLKNGGLIRGRIIENIPNLKVVIKTWADNIYTFQADEIDKIQQETITTLPENRTIYYKTPDWYGIAELAVSIGGKHNIYDAYSNLNGHLGVSAGYCFNRFAALGLACNMDWHRQFGVISLAGEYRGELLKNQTLTPYWHIASGYGFTTNRDIDPEDNFQVGYDYSGGMYWRAGGGIHLRTKSRLGMLFGANFQYQSVKERQWQNNQTWEMVQIWDFNRLLLNISLTF